MPSRMGVVFTQRKGQQASRIVTGGYLDLLATSIHLGAAAGMSGRRKFEVLFDSDAGCQAIDL